MNRCKTVWMAGIAWLAWCHAVGLAAPLEWANPGVSGSFGTPANWNPEMAPANGDDITLGASATPYTVTMSSAFSAFGSLVGQGATWNAQASLYLGHEAFDPLTSVHTNAGTIRFSGANSTWRLLLGAFENSGLVEVSGVAINWQTQTGYNIDNAGGTIQVVNGGSLTSTRYGGSGPRGQGMNITGGTLATDNQGSRLAFESTLSPTFNLTGTSVVNSGEFVLSAMRTGTTGVGSYVVPVNIIDGSLANTGTLVVEKTGDTGNLNEARLSLSGTTAFTNQGTVNIRQLGSGHAGHAALLSSANSLANQGTINIVNPNARLHVTTVGNAFTQTAGTVNLVNGGELRASQVNILGGSLAGNGTITGSTTVAAAAAVAPGASIGTLTFNGNLTLAGTYALEVDKLLGTADLLAVQGILTLDGAILDISYFAYQAGEQSFRIATATGGIVGNFAGVISPANYSLSLLGNGTELWLAIPEPSSLALLALAGLGLLRRCRR